MICDTILDAVGNTPLIRLHRMTQPGDAEVLVKFEGLEVGGSIKTRTALKMIERAEKEGRNELFTCYTDRSYVYVVSSEYVNGCDSLEFLEAVC